MAPAARSLDEALVRAFGAALRGGLLRPRDPAYAAARSVWNAAIDRRPEQPGDVSQTWANIDKAKRLLGYEPRTPFADSPASARRTRPAP